METAARHLLAEYHGCRSPSLDDVDFVRDVLLAAAEAAGGTVLDSTFRRFEPQGVTGVVIIAESHLSVHTWPEHGYVAVDVFTCGTGDPLAAHRVLCAALAPTSDQLLRVDRGLAATPSMRVVDSWVKS